MKHKSQQTATAQAGIGTDTAFNGVAPPLHTSTTFVWPSIDTKGPYDYGRTVNPTRNNLRDVLVALEGGADGEITASGMAAIDLVFNLVHADELILAPHDCYGGTHRLLTHRARQGRFKVKFIDQGDSEALESALSLKPKIVLIETPSNPLMRLVDIKDITTKAKAVGALSVCDNTFLSPVRQNPLNLGCDIVVHSTTKYLNGHSDVVGGAVIAADQSVADELRWWANCSGVSGAPFDSWLTLRGVRTLSARMGIQEANAIALAAFLEGHAKVDKVYYPGLQSDPGYALAQKQQSGPGAMLSFEVKGDLTTAQTFVSKLELFQLAASLGGTESLICQPACMTHAGMAPEARAIAGIKDNLIRVSVGIEKGSDLISDFEQSLVSLTL